MIPDAVLRAIDRRITAEELRSEMERPIREDERETALALVRWFTHRYPAPEDRLSYVRRAYARWQPRPVRPAHPTGPA